MSDYLVSWGPLLLLISVWIFAMMKGGTLNHKKYVAEMKQLAEDQLVEMKRTNEGLARIEQLLREGRQG